MHRSLLAALPLIVAASGVASQGVDPAADHESLRQLKGKLEQAVSKRDFEAASHLFHRPFMATVATQDSFTELEPLKTYYESLFTRKTLRMKEVSIKAEADELSKIYTGTVALTRGSTVERYELTDGRAFDMKGRWTAISIKEADGNWRVLGIHMGTNFMDNPVLTAIERSVLWFGFGGAGAGLVAGLTIGWFVGRRRAQH